MANEIIAINMTVGRVLESIPGWNELDRKDQTFIDKEIKALEASLVDYGMSRLAIGERLANIQEKMSKRMFAAFLQAYSFKRSTAYKNIKEFRNASQRLSKPILSRAAARNMNLLGEKEDRPLGVYTEAAKRLPPPNSTDPKVIDQYLDTLEQAKKRSDARSTKMAEVEADADVLLVQAYRFVSNRLTKLPNRGRAKRAFVDSLVGMMLSEIGVSSAQTFEPESIPEGFKGEVGRPRRQEVA